MKQLGIPGLLVSHGSGSALLEGAVAAITPHPGMSADWLDLAITQWPPKVEPFDVLMRQFKQRNSQSAERLSWLEAKRLSLFGPHRASPSSEL
jgi:hypothetical protein